MDAMGNEWLGPTRVQAFQDVFFWSGVWALPSSLTGQGVDLVEEDDGRSHGPRLPKHLQVPRATIAAGRKKGGVSPGESPCGHKTSARYVNDQSRSQPGRKHLS